MQTTVAVNQGRRHRKIDIGGITVSPKQSLNEVDVKAVIVRAKTSQGVGGHLRALHNCLAGTRKVRKEKLAVLLNKIASYRDSLELTASRSQLLIKAEEIRLENEEVALKSFKEIIRLNGLLMENGRDCAGYNHGWIAQRANLLALMPTECLVKQFPWIC